MASIERRAGKALVYFTFKTVELRPAATRSVFPCVEEAYPQASGPGVVDLGLSPGSRSSHLVGGNEVLGLRDGSRSAWCPHRGPHGGCKANDGCFRLSDDAVPVMHSQRDPRRPGNVLGFPVAVTDA